MYNSALSSTSALNGMGFYLHVPAALLLERTAASTVKETRWA